MSSVKETEKACILVVDDDPLLTQTLQKVLTKAGYFVDTAADGHEGILKAKSGFFHLILCDIRMPGLDGLMTIKAIQEFQDKAGRHRSGFLVISAYDTEEHRRQALQLGVTDFLSKPFDLPAFLEIVAHHVKPNKRKPLREEILAYNRQLEKLIASVKSEVRN